MYYGIKRHIEELTKENQVIGEVMIKRMCRYKCNVIVLQEISRRLALLYSADTNRDANTDTNTDTITDTNTNTE